MNSFYGLSIRRGNPGKLLMGQSVLKIHWCDGSKHGPYGYYGLFEGDFALPFEEKEFVEQFSRDFSLRRNGESGLSVIVPFPDKDISPLEIMRAVVSQYFFPILSGDLIVTVAVGHREHILDAGSVFKFVSGSDLPDKETVVRRLQLAKWCIDLRDESYEHLKEPDVDQAPKWKAGKND